MRRYEEERELTVMLLIDINRSAFFGTQVQTKNALITEIAAVLSFSAINNNDQVGVILFSDRIEKFIPPKKVKSHILRIISDLLDTTPEGKRTNISLALEYFNNVVKKRSIAFVFSDFFDRDFDIPLMIAARKHDVIGVHIHDKREEELPNAGIIRMYDAETDTAQWVDTSDAARMAYTRYYQESVQHFRQAFLKSGADTISIHSQQPYINALHGFFRKRMMLRLLMKRTLLYIIIFFLISHVAAQQNLGVRADKQQYEIGDYIQITITMNGNKSIQYFWPESDALSSFDLISEKPIDTVISGQNITLTKELLISIYEAGTVYYSQVIIPYHIPNDTSTYTLVSDSVHLQISGIQVDTKIMMYFPVIEIHKIL